MENKIKRSKICISRGHKGKNKGNEKEPIFKEMMAMYFPELRSNNQNVYQTGKNKPHLDTL